MLDCSKVSTTLNKYCHTLLNHKKDIIDKLIGLYIPDTSDCRPENTIMDNNKQECSLTQTHKKITFLNYIILITLRQTN